MDEDLRYFVNKLQLIGAESASPILGLTFANMLSIFLREFPKWKNENRDHIETIAAKIIREKFPLEKRVEWKNPKRTFFWKVQFDASISVDQSQYVCMQSIIKKKFT